MYEIFFTPENTGELEVFIYLEENIILQKKIFIHSGLILERKSQVLGIKKKVKAGENSVFGLLLKDEFGFISTKDESKNIIARIRNQNRVMPLVCSYLGEGKYKSSYKMETTGNYVLEIYIRQNYKDIELGIYNIEIEANEVNAEKCYAIKIPKQIKTFQKLQFFLQACDAYGNVRQEMDQFHITFSGKLENGSNDLSELTYQFRYEQCGKYLVEIAGFQNVGEIFVSIIAKKSQERIKSCPFKIIVTENSNVQQIQQLKNQVTSQEVTSNQKQATFLTQEQQSESQIAKSNS